MISWGFLNGMNSLEFAGVRRGPLVLEFLLFLVYQQGEIFELVKLGFRP